MARKQKIPSPALQKPRAGLYLRTFTDGGLSLDEQRQQCQAMALIKGCEVVGVYEDLGAAGTVGATRRTGLKRLLNDVERGAIQVVIMASLDRLGSTIRLVLHLLETMTDHGAHLILCQEQLDTSAPSGQIVLELFGALADLERAALVARTGAGRAARGQRDGEKGGNLPFGYVRNERGIVPDPQTASVERRIFTLRRARATLAMIASVLNAEGVPTQYGGKQWYPSTVRSILANESLYRGGKRGESPVPWPMILDSAAARTAAT